MKAPDKTKKLLKQVLALDAEAQTVLLETIDDETVKSQLQTLLADPNQLDQFLNQIPSSPQPTIKAAIKSGDKIKRIRIEKLLGQGGMGAVYLGFDEKLERQVAVKAIRHEYLQNPATQQRFEREAQILSKINHPSICQLYDYIETTEGDFLVLEYIKGQPLYQVAMTVQQKLTAMADLAAALAVAHDYGIVHRDLKPDNIMMTDEGQLKVLDFGIAQSMSKPKVSQATKSTAESQNQNDQPDLTQQGSLVGTIRYMSPEQAQGKVIQTASDLYALGIVAQEIFSHQAAYPLNETEQLLSDVQQGKRIEVSGLPAAVQKLITALTQLEPKQRPTAQAAAAQFTAILNAPQMKKKQAIKFSVIAAGLLLVMILFWQWQQFNSQATSSKQVKNYQSQIDELVKQGEQIYVLPIHPIKDEINSLLQQGDRLFTEIENDSVLSSTDKKRLQGIILLKGGYFESAIPVLEAGLADNQLLADAWTQLYIEKATDFSDQQGFEQTLKDATLRVNYLQPALKYIELAAQETGQVNPLFQAFVLSQTESLESGLTAVNQILTDEQWNKEAVNLKGLILSAAMSLAREKGQWQQAKSYALMAAETYQRSTQMVRSYPYNYASLCLINFGLMVDGIQRSGEQVEAFSQQSIAACENALQLQPDYKYPKQLLARIYMMNAMWQTDMGIDATDSLAKAKDWNQQASSLQDLFSHSWNQALILATEAKQLMLQGKDAQPVIKQSLELFKNLLKVSNEYRPYVVSDLLFVLSFQAHALIQKNQDASKIYQNAQDMFDEALLTENLMVSEQWGLINNMAQVYRVELVDQFEQGQNILPLGQKLLAFLNPADNRLNDDPNQLINLANTHLLLAEYLRRQQQPMGEHLNSATEYINQALNINATHYSILLSQANLITLQQYYSEQNYEAANQLYERVIAINDKNPYNHHAWANSLWIQAQNGQTNSQQLAAIKRADETIKQALLIDENNRSFIKTQSEILELADLMDIQL